MKITPKDYLRARYGAKGIPEDNTIEELYDMLDEYAALKCAKDLVQDKNPVVGMWVIMDPDKGDVVCALPNKLPHVRQANSADH